MTSPVPVSGPTPVAPALTSAAAPRPSGGWLTQLWRLTVWEMFLAVRRLGMFITLVSILLAGYLLLQLFIWLTVVSFSGADEAVSTQPLVFPDAALVAGQYFNEIGVLLLIVLVGALIGAEYGYGTHRLSLARGVGRGQLLLAQVIAIAIMALVSSGAMVLIGSGVGYLGGLGLGGAAALSVAGIGELLAFWLAIALNAFAYGLVALWMGTIGRSTAAAIAGPLVYIFVELVAMGLFAVFRAMPYPNATTRFISSIPDYLLGSNTSEVIQLAGQSPYALLDHTGHLGLAHGLITVAIYCALFIFSAYLVFRSRDVRE